MRHLKLERTLSLFFLTVFFLQGCILRPSPKSPSPPQDSPPSSTPNQPPKSQKAQKIPVFAPKVLNATPHDTDAYTQGLLYHEGTLWESNGRRGHSNLRQLDLKTGKVLQEIHLDSQYFAEGLSFTPDQKQLIQLTWQSQKAFSYSWPKLKPQGELSYRGEGWGLTTDGHSLIKSSGNASLTWHPPNDLNKVLKQLTIKTHDGEPIHYLNELEWVEGYLYCNVYQTPYILILKPDQSVPVMVLNCSHLLTQEEAKGVDVFNGIAFDPQEQRLWVTGKLWPKLFELDYLEIRSKLQAIDPDFDNLQSDNPNRAR